MRSELAGHDASPNASRRSERNPLSLRASAYHMRPVWSQLNDNASPMSLSSGTNIGNSYRTSTLHYDQFSRVSQTWYSETEDLGVNWRIKGLNVQSLVVL